MEAFPAADDRGWETIRRTIDDSDCYILIVGWRYGTIDPGTELSWTHREYRYAKERRVPILAFLRDEAATPLSRADRDGGARIREFRNEIQSEKLYKSWRHGEDLCNTVVEALGHQIRLDQDGGTERLGWLRGDATQASAETLDELARLSRENPALEARLDTIERSEIAELSLVLPPSMQVPIRHTWQPRPDTIPLQLSPTVTATPEGRRPQTRRSSMTCPRQRRPHPLDARASLANGVCTLAEDLVPAQR